jgi:glutamine amidotransferase
MGRAGRIAAACRRKVFPMKAARVGVVDYGAGNLRSVAKALERSGLDVTITDDPKQVPSFDGVVLPGVGAFRDAVIALRESGLEDAVKQAVENDRPYLGMCFGLQLLFEEGDEHGVTEGFGLLPGRVERFPKTDPAGADLRVPQIGWNQVEWSGDHPMLVHMPKKEYYYFVHSYRPVPSDASIVVGRTEYGGTFASAVATPRLFATQFHPEKSQQAGRKLLDAYRRWVEESR